jgi:hypothetical protein
VPDTAPFADRVARGLQNLTTNPPETGDAAALVPLRRSLERTLTRLRTGGAADSAVFRFQLTGGKTVLYLAKEALPTEPARLVPIINAIQLNLQPGESIDLDGSLAAWLIRPDAALTESNLRQADITLRGLKAGRDRDHVAAQTAESAKIRLRARLNQLVTALQYAQKDAEAPLPFTPVPIDPQLTEPTPSPVVAVAPPPPPTSAVAAKPAPAAPAAAVAELTPVPAGPAEPPEEAVSRALRRILAAVEGTGFKAVVIGDAGHRAWGSRKPVRRIELLVPFEGPQKQTVLGAARGEGLRPAPDDEPLHLEYPDAATGAVIPVDLIQAVSSSHKKVVSRAQQLEALGARVRAASVEDLILQRAASDRPGHAESVIELFRRAAERVDAAYLKQEAEATGAFDRVKAAWKKSREQA